MGIGMFIGMIVSGAVIAGLGSVLFWQSGNEFGPLGSLGMLLAAFGYILTLLGVIAGGVYLGTLTLADRLEDLRDAMNDDD